MATVQRARSGGPARDELFADVSHDLRAPVAVIKTSLDVVLASAPPELPPPLRRLIANADLAADRLANLVDDLIDLTRARAGHLQLRLARTDLAALARRAASQIEPLARDRGQRLELDIPRRSVRLDVDAGRLERALLNLLVNANQHGRAGGIIRLSLTTHPGAVELVVADDGPGVPPADRAHVFERFYRADPAATGQGAGLGLPIARALVELHGGRLTLDSAPGAGATFRILLPRRYSSSRTRPPGQEMMTTS